MNLEWWGTQIVIYAFVCAIGWVANEFWRRRYKRKNDSDLTMTISCDTSSVVSALNDVEERLKRIIRLQDQIKPLSLRPRPPPKRI